MRLAKIGAWFRMKYIGAHSKMVLRVHGMHQARVRFPVGPPLRSPLASFAVQALTFLNNI